MGTLVKPLPHPYESGEASKLRWYRILRPLRGSRLVPWEEEMTADWHRLTMRTHWVGNRSTLSAQLELTVTDEEAGGAVLLRLQGGYVDNGRGGQTVPSDPVITAAGATSRAVCKLRAQDAWSWTLQQMRPGSGASDIECSVCMSPFHEPVRFPAQPGSACGHIFCRGCVVRCLAAEHQKRASGGPAASALCCPLCRAPMSLAQGDPPVDRELWEALQQSYPDVVARRRKRMGRQGVAASSAEGAGVPAAAGVAQHEPPAELVRDRIRAQMGTHRRLLTSALPEYCTLLEYELARPIHEIARCKCPERFVMVRRQVRREGGNRGREYQSCPLSRPTSQQRGTGQESRFGCGTFQWVV